MAERDAAVLALRRVEAERNEARRGLAATGTTGDDTPVATAEVTEATETVEEPTKSGMGEAIDRYLHLGIHRQ
jgi:hypothetical protein